MSVLLNYDINPNLQGFNAFGRRPANANGNAIAIWNTKVAATTDTTLTVPSNVAVGNLANDKPWILAIFGYQAASTVFVADGATAAPDTSGTFAAKNGAINPTALLVKGGDVLHFYPLADSYVSVEFYSVT